MKDAIATLKLLPPEQWTARCHMLNGYSISPLRASGAATVKLGDEVALGLPTLRQKDNLPCYDSIGWLLRRAGVDLESLTRYLVESTLPRVYGMTREQVMGLKIVNDDDGLEAAITWLERNYTPPGEAA